MWLPISIWSAPAGPAGVANLDDRFGEPREGIFSRLASPVLAIGEDRAAATRLARIVVALHSEGFVTVDRPVAEAIRILLEGMVGRPRRLGERVSLYRRFARLDHRRIPDLTAFAIRHLGAGALARSGKVHVVVRQYWSLVVDQRRELGADHPDTLTTRLDLAWWLAEGGRLRDAVPRLVDLVAARLAEVLADLVRVLGADHRHTLSARHDLAHALAAEGRLQEAVSLSTDLVADTTRVLGVDDPQALTACHDLACCLARTESWEEAVSEFTEVVEHRRRVLGTDHPDTLLSRCWLAYCLGKTAGAAEEVRGQMDVVADHKRVLGPDHPQTLITRHNLADLLGRDGRGDQRAHRRVGAEDARVGSPTIPRLWPASTNWPGGWSRRAGRRKRSASTKACCRTGCGCWARTIPTRSAPATAWPTSCARPAGGKMRPDSTPRRLSPPCPMY